MLGPFALSLFGVIEKGEHHREDKMVRGFDLHEPQFKKRSHPLGFFCSSFMLFKAIEMTHHEYKYWAALDGARLYSDE